MLLIRHLSPKMEIHLSSVECFFFLSHCFGFLACNVWLSLTALVSVTSRGSRVVSSENFPKNSPYATCSKPNARHSKS